MKRIVIYKGKYGATAQYAEWLGKAVQAPVVEAENIARENLDRFDCVILGSSVYIGKLQLRSWIKENEPYLKGKSLFIFIVCGTPPDKTRILQKIAYDNLPGDIWDRSNIYFLPGRLIRKNISVMDRMLLRLGSLATRDPLEKQRMLSDFDKVNIKSLYPLIQDINAEVTGGKLSCPAEIVSDKTRA